jgi:outer membrane protein assembly factor BamB
LLVANGSLYLAGRSLVQVDPSSGEKLGQVKGNSTSTHATFTFPLADSKLILSGYSSDSRTVPNSLYGITPSSGQVVWKIPSMNAQGVLTGARVIALDAAGSVFYNETTGQPVATQKSLFSDWFAGDSMMFTVASVGKKGATLYAYGSGGKKAWAATVGPRINTQGWPHAVDGTGVYVAMMTPRQGVEGFDPHTGSVLWRRALPAVQRLAAANGLVFVLTAGIGQTLKLVVLHADTGKPVGQLALTGGYYAFPTNNELMIAGGMVFIRAVSPTGSTVLVALGR